MAERKTILEQKLEIDFSAQNSGKTRGIPKKDSWVPGKVAAVRKGHPSWQSKGTCSECVCVEEMVLSALVDRRQ